MNTLEKICTDKRHYVARQKEAVLLSTLKDALKAKGTKQVSDYFRSMMLAHRQAGEPALIAEVKKASPSKGVICNSFDPKNIAQDYIRGGAACISVLTDTPYFQGCDEDFKAVKACVHRPLLRKDFIVDAYQIYETAVMGADCLLLIVAALSDEELNTFYTLGKSLGLSVLVETHTHAEIERAVAIKADMIGINARNLKTLDVDMDLVSALRSNIPKDTVCIAESGIRNSHDIYRFFDMGFDAFLVGESLMRSENTENAVRALLTRP